jgi:hypothetical protein
MDGMCIDSISNSEGATARVVVVAMFQGLDQVKHWNLKYISYTTIMVYEKKAKKSCGI